MITETDAEILARGNSKGLNLKNLADHKQTTPDRPGFHTVSARAHLLQNVLDHVAMFVDAKQRGSGVRSTESQLVDSVDRLRQFDENDGWEPVTE